MGKEIVYCGGCGKSLREDDFAKGKAHTVDNRPFCIACKPLPQGRSSQHQTSARLPAIAKGASGRMPAAPPPSTRRHAPVDGSGSSKTPIIIGAVLVGAALLLLLLFMARSGDRHAPDVPPDPPAQPAKNPPRPGTTPSESERAAAAFKELEAFLATSPRPVAVLQRCEDVRPILRGTPFEAKLKEIEERARDAHKSQQVDASLDEVKKLRALDPKFERKEEILRLLRATLPMAGNRKGDVEEAIRQYEKDAQATGTKPPPPPPPPPTPAFGAGSGSGPFETDANGAIQNWLVVGPFPTRDHREGLYDHDLLGTELAHVPAAGLEVSTRQGTKLRWTSVAVPDGKLLFRKVEGFSAKPDAAIAFAACWVECERDMEVKFKTHGEMGFYFILDGKRVWNQPLGHPFAGNEDVVRFPLTKGPHLLLYKFVTTGEPFGLKIRLTDNIGVRQGGIRVWTQAPAARKIVLAEFFNEGPGRFTKGELVDGGVEGTKAYAIPQTGVWLDHPFAAPISPTLTVRFKLKPLFDVRNVEAMMWSSKLGVNAWVHIRGLKKGEWNVVEFKLKDARGGYQMTGASVEGDMPDNFRLSFDDPVPDGRILLDDFELFE